MSQRANYDSPWKTIVEQHFGECLAFYFPDLYCAIDWLVAPIFLEQELQKIRGDSDVGLRRVDKLVDVQLKSGENIWLLIHIEIQRKPDDRFAERMFIYHYRIFERFHRHPVSLAILTDRKVDWHPKRYEHAQFGSKLQLDFATAKLLDYKDEAALLASSNPFALVTLAQLAENKAGKRINRRYATKLRLMRLLFAQGYSKEAIRNLLIFIDWILQLPKALEVQLKLTLAETSGEKVMQYIPSWERYAKEAGFEEGLERGRERGREEGLILAITTILEARFDEIPKPIELTIQELDEEPLREVLLFASVVKSLAAMRKFLDGLTVEEDSAESPYTPQTTPNQTSDT